MRQWLPRLIIPLSVTAAYGFVLFLSMRSPPLEDENGVDQRIFQDYEFNESSYLAVKGDGMGVIDLAFRETRHGPRWILNTRAHPFRDEISVIRCADTHRLRIIQDSLKCRAIISLNRAGAEPYFPSQGVPPRDSWIDSGFPVDSKLTQSHSPFAYFAHATYIPFATMESISFQIGALLGIGAIKSNSRESRSKAYTIDFPNPPQSLRYVLCWQTVFHQQVYMPYIQFEIGGQWRPPIPPQWSLKKSIVIENVLGIWWGETFPFIPIHIGVVVSDKANLQNTII